MAFSLKKLATVGGVLNPVGMVSTVGAGLLAGGADIYSAQLAAKGQRDANEASVASARERMAFEERMSDTAHQREVADLKAAGLNPVLSANSGASTLVGASVDFENAAPNYSGIAGKSLATAMQAMQMKKDFQKLDTEISYNKAAEMNQARQAEASAASAAVARARAKEAEADAFITSKDAEWIRDNPKWFQVKKALELMAPAVGTARDLAIGYRGLKGFGDERTETFDAKGEHRKTTIKSKGN